MKSKINYKAAIENIRSELKTYIVNGNLKSIVLGVSGGIDSTLCALLAKPVCDQLNIPLIGRSLPSATNTNGENSRAKSFGKLFCSEFKETGIQSIYNKMVDKTFDNYNEYPEDNDTEEQIRFGNIKARIRMILLYDLASAEKGLVLSTDNYTEYLLGFWTLHGDVGDYGMIQNLWKTEVYEMAEWIANNEYIKNSSQYNSIIDVIEADATDGLGISNTDLDQIMPDWKGNSRDGYAKVDQILKNHGIAGVGDLDDPVLQRFYRTNFKRNNPYNIPRKNITNK